MYFQFYPLYCYDILHILVPYGVHFFHTIFYFMVCVCILYIYNDVLYMSFTSDIYIFEIYTLAKNCTVLYALQVAHIIIPKTILNFTSVISHEMSQYDIC